MNISDLPEDAKKEAFKTTYAACIIQAEAKKGCQETPNISALDAFCDCKNDDQCNVSYGYGFSHNIRVPAFAQLGGEKLFIVEFCSEDSLEVKIIYVEDD